jgi:hypothetical protein
MEARGIQKSWPMRAGQWPPPHGKENVMKRKEFEKCCQAIEEGELIFIENMATRQSGRLLYCHSNEFRVNVGGKREAWPAAACEEAGGSSESPHKNI